MEFKVGLIGMGKRMRWFVRELRKIGGVDVVAICDVVPEAVAAFGDELGIAAGKRYSEYNRLIQDEDVQVVISVTPNHVHGEIVRSCLLAQKPLITEKPFTRTFDEAVELLQLFSENEANSALCMIGFTKRYFPGLRYAREMVRSGKIGRVRHASLKYFQGWGSASYQSAMNWRLQKEFTGTGTLADLGAHIIDAARFLFGEFVEVSGRMHTLVEQRKDNRTGEMVPVEVDDFVSFEALLEGGVAGVFQSTRNALGEQDVIEIQIYGDEGTIYFRNSAQEELEWVRKSADGPDLIRETLAAPVSCRYGEVEDFFDRLRGLERDGFPDLVDGYLNQEVIEAIIRASEERRTVTIQEVRPAGLKVPSDGKGGIYSSQAAWEDALNNRKFVGSAPFAYPDVDPKLPNVLLIGDSISMGYTSTVRSMLQEKANVFRIPENGGDTWRGLEKLAGWLDHVTWDVIHFNWGLHDLKYMKDGQLDFSGEIVSTPEQYERNLRQLVKDLQATGAKLIWANTTPVPAESNGRVQDSEQIYNAKAAEVMREQGIPINDLNGLVRSTDFHGALPSNVHFDAEGYAQLGNQAAEKIGSLLASD